jgi:hypothetical protein
MKESHVDVSLFHNYHNEFITNGSGPVGIIDSNGHHHQNESSSFSHDNEDEPSIPTTINGVSQYVNISDDRLASGLLVTVEQHKSWDSSINIESTDQPPPISDVIIYTSCIESVPPKYDNINTLLGPFGLSYEHKELHVDCTIDDPIEVQENDNNIANPVQEEVQENDYDIIEKVHENADDIIEKVHGNADDVIEEVKENDDDIIEEVQENDDDNIIEEVQGDDYHTRFDSKDVPDRNQGMTNEEIKQRMIA